MEHDKVSALPSVSLARWPLSLNNDFCTQVHHGTGANARLSLTKKPITPFWNKNLSSLVKPCVSAGPGDAMCSRCGARLSLWSRNAASMVGDRVWPVMNIQSWR